MKSNNNARIQSQQEYSQATIIVHLLPEFVQYDQDRKGEVLNYAGKSLLESHSLYTDFQIAFDTISLRTVFKFINQQEAID